jgi:5-hydroxyisourate hydrolase
MSVSTHVLDNARGEPAAGVPVRLLGPGVELAGTTGADGRLSFAQTLAPGRYRLVFDTAAYLGPEAFYPSVSVEFQVSDPRRPLHLPLLLNPYGYTTYRGS